MNRLTNVKKIAVLRASNLGDYVAATPALDALRQTYPEAEIVYLGRPFHQSLIESRPGPVDRVVVVPVSQGVRFEQHMPHLQQNEHELDAFFQRMQAERFDLALQMHGGGKNSNPFLRRLGAAFNVGAKTPDAIALDRWIPYFFFQNEVFRLVELVRLVGAEPSNLEPHIDVTGSDSAEVHKIFPALADSPFAVLHPGASDTRRRWPPERFAQVGDALAEAGFQVVITGIEPERAVIEQVISLMRCPAINACEQLSLKGLVGLVASAALVISNDTGTMHLANAVHTLNVGIFWCVNYLNWSHLGRARHRPLVSWTVNCPLCGMDITGFNSPNKNCNHETSLVAGVSVDEVVSAAFDLLNYAEQFPGEKSAFIGEGLKRSSA
jgi:ADP-heptose:LPS heptosyltransferase